MAPDSKKMMVFQNRKQTALIILMSALSISTFFVTNRQDSLAPEANVRTHGFHENSSIHRIKLTKPNNGIELSH